MQFRYYRNFGTAFALMVTFLVCGAWHGLSWGFIVWGFIHGLYMGVSVYYRDIQKHIHKKTVLEKSKLKRYWQIFFTFNLVSFSWIFFRSKNLSGAYFIVSNLFKNFYKTMSSMWSIEGIRYNVVFYKSRREFLVAIMGLMIIALVHIIKKYRNYEDINDFLNATPYWIKSSAYYLLILIITIFMYDAQEPFIYFKF